MVGEADRLDPGVTMTKKTMILAVIVICLLSGASAFSEYRDAAAVNEDGIERNEAGGGRQTKELRYRIDDEEERTITIEVSPQILSEKEAERLLQSARKEWEACYLGENASAEHIDQDLLLPESLADGLVSVSYLSDQPTVIDDEGKIQEGDIPEEGMIVRMETVFSYETYELSDIRSLHVFPPKKNAEQKLEERVEDAAVLAEQNSRAQKMLLLPTEIDGHRVVWQAERSRNWILILLLGCAALAAVYFKKGEDEKRKVKEREEQLLYEYPQMIEQMCLLLGSGMTIRRAWERMVYTDQKQREMHRLPERLFAKEMGITEREMRKGRGERECYERFAGRIGLEPYRRFVSILTRNLSKGNDDIRQLLTEEAGQAMIIRKNTAIRLGEEASTKLLGPMLLMFLVILAAVIFPAFVNF